MNQKRFAQLRQLLLCSPSPGIWRQLFLLLESWPENEGLELAVEYAEQHLSHWPDSLRFVSSNMPLVQKRKNSSLSVSPLWSLFRTFYNEYSSTIPLTDFAYWPESSMWTHLEDCRSSVSAYELEALARSPMAEHLQYLRLGRFSFHREQAEILTSSFPALEYLDLSAVDNPPNMPLLGMCSESLWASQLKMLKLPHAYWQPDEVELWCEELPFPQLQWFETRVLPEGQYLEAWVRAKQTSTLRFLDLGAVSEGNVMSLLAFVIETPSISNLKALSLPDMHSIGLRALVVAPHLSSLEYLDLDALSMDDDEIETLCSQKVAWKGLKYFSCEDKSLEHSEVKAITEAPWYNSLEYLSLDSSLNGVYCLEPLWEKGLPPNLRVLRLCDCGITEKELEEMLRVLPDSVEEIALAINPLGKQGIQMILESDRLANLKILNLNECGITQRTLPLVHESSLYQQLETLYVAQTNGLNGDLVKKMNKDKGSASPLSSQNWFHFSFESVKRYLI